MLSKHVVIFSICGIYLYLQVIFVILWWCFLFSRLIPPRSSRRACSVVASFNPIPESLRKFSWRFDAGNKTQMLTRCFTGTCADVFFIFKIFGIFLSVYHRRREEKHKLGGERRPQAPLKARTLHLPGRFFWTAAASLKLSWQDRHPFSCGLIVQFISYFIFVQFWSF